MNCEDSLFWFKNFIKYVFCKDFLLVFGGKWIHGVGFEIGSCFVAQAGPKLKLLWLSLPNPQITSVFHCAPPLPLSMTSSGTLKFYLWKSLTHHIFIRGMRYGFNPYYCIWPIVSEPPLKRMTLSLLKFCDGFVKNLLAINILILDHHRYSTEL